MSTARALAGLAAGAALPAIAIAMHGSVLSFIDMGALLLAPGLGLALTLGLHGAKATLAALRAGLGGTTSGVDVGQHLSVLHTLRRTLLGGAMLGLLVGGFQAFQTLDDPSFLGPAIATWLLAALYGGTLADLVVAPFAQRLHAAHPDASPLPPPSAPYVFVALVGLGTIGMVAVVLPWFLDAPTVEDREDAEYIRLLEGRAGGDMFTLRSFQVRMATEEGTREATFSLALQAREGEADALEALLAARSPIVREAVLLLALDTKATDLAGSGGLETFQARIMRELLVVLQPEGLGLQAVYLTDFNLSTD